MEKTLDSKVFFAIPRQDLDDIAFHTWLDQELVREWLLHEGEPERLIDLIVADMTSAINAPYPLVLDGRPCKFERYDSTSPLGRGIQLRDHYTLAAVECVNYVANSLESFLQKQKIVYERRNFYRPA